MYEDEDVEEYFKMRELQRTCKEQGFDLSLMQTQNVHDKLMRGMQVIQRTWYEAYQEIEEIKEMLSAGNVKTGMSKLRNLSRRGFPLAWYMLGEFYLRGKYVNKDYFYALYYLTKADDRMVSEATELLAECFSKGLGVAVNKERAKILLEKLKEEE